jgi:hypothetical protein
VLLVNVQRNELLHGDYLTSRSYATLSPFCNVDGRHPYRSSPTASATTSTSRS